MAPTPERAAPSDGPGSLGPVATLVAIGMVSIPVAVGQLLVAFFTALCGSGPASVAWFLLALLTPLILAMAQMAMQRRWPMPGLGAAIGRLVLVAVAVLAVAALAMATIEGSDDCQSTIGTVDDAPASHASVAQMS